MSFLIGLGCGCFTAKSYQTLHARYKICLLLPGPPFVFFSITVCLVVVVLKLVDQTAVVRQIIFRTRCKAPDLVNYNSVRVITALQDS